MYGNGQNSCRSRKSRANSYQSVAAASDGQSVSPIRVWAVMLMYRATLWAAIQYLGPRETAPEHRHSQNAFRFVIEGEGVWTVVNGDPVRMSRGDLLLTPGWHFHGHHNDTDKPMAWIDGLDIPFAQQNDVGFFEFGADRVTDYATPRFPVANGCGAIPDCVRFQVCKTP
jgi:mannose-6-phosphate isomerase-like protein (cupin superfamily)